MKISIIYDSENGHTEAVAKAVAEGARSVEKAQVFLKHVRNADTEALADMDAIIWGCPGYFGTISGTLKSWIDKLVVQWAQGQLIGKVGGVFCTAASVHGGIETTLMSLITPMLHQGMIIVGLPANVPENSLIGSFYGVGLTCPVETSPDAPPNMPSLKELSLGHELGRRVAEVAKKVSTK